jgi:hypothetical protein
VRAPWGPAERAVAGDELAPCLCVQCWGVQALVSLLWVGEFSERCLLPNQEPLQANWGESVLPLCESVKLLAPFCPWTP